VIKNGERVRIWSKTFADCMKVLPIIYRASVHFYYCVVLTVFAVVMEITLLAVARVTVLEVVFEL
jgi:hypothetical protein